jgi:ribosomal protein L37AE/L43A
MSKIYVQVTKIRNAMGFEQPITTMTHVVGSKKRKNAGPNFHVGDIVESLRKPGLRAKVVDVRGPSNNNFDGSIQVQWEGQAPRTDQRLWDKSGFKLAGSQSAFKNSVQNDYVCAKCGYKMPTKDVLEGNGTCDKCGAKIKDETAFLNKKNAGKYKVGDKVTLTTPNIDGLYQGKVKRVTAPGVYVIELAGSNFVGADEDELIAGHKATKNSSPFKVGQSVKIDGKPGKLVKEIPEPKGYEGAGSTFMFKEDKTGKTYEVNDHDLQSFNSMKNKMDVSGMDAQIEYWINRCVNPNKKLKLIDLQKRFDQVSRHHTPADEGSAAAIFDTIEMVAKDLMKNSWSTTNIVPQLKSDKRTKEPGFTVDLKTKNATFKVGDVVDYRARYGDGPKYGKIVSIYRYSSGPSSETMYEVRDKSGGKQGYRKADLELKKNTKEPGFDGDLKTKNAFKTPDKFKPGQKVKYGGSVGKIMERTGEDMYCIQDYEDGFKSKYESETYLPAAKIQKI